MTATNINHNELGEILGRMADQIFKQIEVTPDGSIEEACLTTVHDAIRDMADELSDDSDDDGDGDED